MKRRNFDARAPQPRNQSPRERLEQADSARKELLARHAKNVAQRTSKAAADRAVAEQRPVRDRALYQTALSAMPFWQAGESEKLTVSDPYLKLVEAALRNMHERTREAVLCWPAFDPSPCGIAALLALADNAVTRPTKHEQLDARAPPVGLRALVYPYARTLHRPLRHVYVDSKYIGRLHLLHQVRAMGRNEDGALADYHKTLARSQTLSGVALLDGKTYDEFRHPCLDETLPTGPCVGTDGRMELMWRVRTQTDLSKISRTGMADDPLAAKFYLFGLRAKDSLLPSLRALSKRLDVVFLDLSQTGRHRLGPDWPARVQTFLAELDNHVGPLATIALTDDPWSFDALRFGGLARPNRTKAPSKPEPSSIIFAKASDLVVPYQQPLPQFALLQKVDAFGFSGVIEALFRRIRADARAAAGLNDRGAAELLHRLAGTIRRCASLPGSRDDLSAYVQGEVAGGMAAADLLASYRISALISELRKMVGPWAQHHHAELVDLCAAVERVWSNTGQLTPMAPLLRDVIKRFLRVSSRTAVHFRNDMLADFATHALGRDSEIGETVTGRIEKALLLMLDRGGLDDLALLPSAERNHIKTLIVVAPTRAQMMALLARDWLPDNLLVLADSDALSSAARDAARLANYPELIAIKHRMLLFSEKAAQAVHRAGGDQAPPDSDLEQDDVEFPSSTVVNLAGNVRGDQPTLRFKLSGEQTVIARPGTKLILLDRTRAVPIFTECEAKDVDVGDRICVIGDAFLEMARPLLNITARAAEEIRDYHNLILERFGRLPGSSQSERLTNVVMAMAMPSVTSQRANYWVDLADQLNVPLHEVVPHAPRDRTTFAAFMAALGVSDAIASRFWTWAVIAQRASRVRAAMNFHDAYRTILIDNYAAQSSNPEAARDIRHLKTAAEDFVGVIQEIIEQRGDRERA